MNLPAGSFAISSRSGKSFGAQPVAKSGGDDPITLKLELYEWFERIEEPANHASDSGLVEVDYVTGPRLFRDGDKITINKVEASSPTPGVGDKVVVSGMYSLDSQAAAKIGMFVTQTEGDGKSQIKPKQQLAIGKGEGEFELSIHIRHEGYLHVTFYPIDGGSGFGGIYFGRPEQMEKIKDWKLD